MTSAPDRSGLGGRTTPRYRNECTVGLVFAYQPYAPALHYCCAVPLDEGTDMWDKASLHNLIASKLTDYQIIVVANREPYQHRYVGDDDTIDCIRPASGMATALDPVMRASGGVWVGHGSGDADRATVDEHDHVEVPPEDPSYTLRRVWLTKEQEEGYYHGLSNEGLWPLCHITFTRPVFDPRHWEMYREVNAQFGDAVLEEAGDRPTFVFIQDYHFALLPRYLKDRNPNLIIAQFWHIPWPNREVFRVFPWKEELLDGMLGNDLLGFHVRYHCQNFMDTVDRTLEARIDFEQAEIVHKNKTTLVRPFPISIDFERHTAMAATEPVEQEMTRWRQQMRQQVSSWGSASSGLITPRASRSGCGPSTGCSRRIRSIASVCPSSRSAFPAGAMSLSTR